MTQPNQTCDEITAHLIQQFLELEANLIRLKMDYKAKLAHEGENPGGRRGFDFSPRAGQGRILAILKLQPEI